MTELDVALLANLGAALAFSVASWAVSLRLRNASVVDVGWGLGCVLVAWLTFALTDGVPARRVLVVALTTIWGLRLSAHLARRIACEAEDFRYRELRQRHGRRFPLLSLFTVFGFQLGLGVWTVTLPVQAALAADSPATLTVLDGVGVVVFAFGLFFEVVGDQQLARFRADPRNRGQVLDRGLWRYTRHPNYFGDFCVWWGLYAIALATGEWWTVIGPLVMSYVLLRVSGVRAMEAHLGDGREGYAEYVQRTPAFFPLPRSRKPSPL